MTQVGCQARPFPIRNLVASLTQDLKIIVPLMAESRIGEMMHIEARSHRITAFTLHPRTAQHLCAPLPPFGTLNVFAIPVRLEEGMKQHVPDAGHRPLMAPLRGPPV